MTDQGSFPDEPEWIGAVFRVGCVLFVLVGLLAALVSMMGDCAEDSHSPEWGACQSGRWHGPVIVGVVSASLLTGIILMRRRHAIVATAVLWLLLAYLVVGSFVL